MKRLICAAVLGAVFLLAGCSADSLTKVDDKIASQPVQNTIDVACGVYNGVKVGWDAYVAGHDVKASVVENVNLAIAGIDVLCLKPYPDNTTSAIAKVMAAATTVIINLQREDPDAAKQTASRVPGGAQLLTAGQTG